MQSRTTLTVLLLVVLSGCNVVKTFAEDPTVVERGTAAAESGPLPLTGPTGEEPEELASPDESAAAPAGNGSLATDGELRTVVANAEGAIAPRADRAGGDPAARTALLGSATDGDLALTGGFNGRLGNVLVQYSSYGSSPLIITAYRDGTFKAWMYANDTLGYIDLVSESLLYCEPPLYYGVRLTVCHPSGRLADISWYVQYANGQPIRNGSTFYHEDGTVLFDGYSFRAEGGEILRYGSTFYWPNGQRLNDGWRLSYPNGLSMYESGGLYAERADDWDREESLFARGNTVYYPAGVFARFVMVNDVTSKTSPWLYPNNRPLTGTDQLYYPSGALAKNANRVYSESGAPTSSEIRRIYRFAAPNADVLLNAETTGDVISVAQATSHSVMAAQRTRATVAPATPATLTMPEAETTSQRIVVRWSAAAYATSYLVALRAAHLGQPTCAEGLEVTGLAAAFQGLAPATRYLATICAKNAYGLSPERRGSAVTRVVLPFTDAFSLNGPLAPVWRVISGQAAIIGGRFATDSAVSLARVFGASRDVRMSVRTSLDTTRSQSTGLVARYQGPAEQNMYMATHRFHQGKAYVTIYRNLSGTWTALRNVQVAQTAGLLRFEAVGASLRAFLDDVLVAQVIDRTLPNAGFFGLRTTSTPVARVHADDFAVEDLADIGPRVTLPYNDDFARGDADAVGTDWLVEGGHAGLRGGALASLAPGAVTIASVLSHPLADVTVRTRFTLDAGNGASQVGLVARHAELGDRGMYMGRIRKQSGIAYAEIYRNVAGVWTALRSARTTFTSGELRFDAVGPSLRLYVDDQLLAQVSDATLTQPGRVGLRVVLNDGRADDFSVALHTQIGTPVALPYLEDFERADDPAIGDHWRVERGDARLLGSRLRGSAVPSMTSLLSDQHADLLVEGDLTLPSTNGHYAALGARHTGLGDRDMYQALLVRRSGATYAEIVRNAGGVSTVLWSRRVAASAGRLTLGLAGSTQALMLDGRIIGIATDTALTAPGRALVRLSGSGAATADNVAIIPVPVAVPYLPTTSTDDFERRDGNDLGFAWLAETGTLSLKGGKGRGTPKTVALASHLSEPQADVTLELDYDLVPGTGTKSVSLFARHSGQGDKNLYLATVSGHKGAANVTISRIVGGKALRLGNAIPLPQKAGRLRFDVVGSQLTASIDGVAVLTVSDTLLSGPGRVGIRMNSASAVTATATFDNFAVRPYQP